MPDFKFTIIIPTKNRADTLYWTLKTCVEQQYQNLEIIVSDNFSTDSTKDVVLSFNDERIKYINTGSPLSMTGNWEFALSQVSEGYVSFLGDDDGFLPDAISRINNIANEDDYDAINASCIEYNWPNHLNSLYRNNMFFIEKNIDKHPNVRILLKKVLSYELPYSALPWLYKGFVSITLLQKIKKTSLLFFNSRTPDIYSAIAIGSVIQNKKYYYSEIPFAINGASSHSNGVSQISKTKNAGALEFHSDLSIPFHKDLVICNSFPIYIYECYLQARDAGILNKKIIGINLEFVLNEAMKQAQNNSGDMYSAIKNAVIEIAYKNNFDKHTLSIILEKYPNRNIFLRTANKTKNRYFSNVDPIDMTEYKVENVYEAATVADRMLKKEIKPAAANTLKRISKDIITILKKS